jgi:prophage tail gpP-like protein
VAELTMPGNLESARLDIDASQLYSRYEVTGRADTRQAAEASERDAVVAVVEDPTVGRYRLRRVRLESWATPEQCALRAQWEAASRQGDATRYTCTVGSWRIGPGGDVWEPGMLVHVADQINGVDADMVVAEVDLSYGLDGTRASLGLRLPCAYVPEPVFARPVSQRRGKAKTPAAGVSWWAPSTGFGVSQ